MDSSTGSLSRPLDFFSLPTELLQKIMLEYLKDEYISLKCVISKLHAPKALPTNFLDGHACNEYKASTSQFVIRIGQLITIDVRFRELMTLVLKDLFIFIKHEDETLTTVCNEIDEQIQAPRGSTGLLGHAVNDPDSIIRTLRTGYDVWHSVLSKQYRRWDHDREDLEHLREEVMKVAYGSYPQVKWWNWYLRLGELDLTQGGWTSISSMTLEQ